MQISTIKKWINQIRCLSFRVPALLMVAHSHTIMVYWDNMFGAAIDHSEQVEEGPW